MQSEITWAEISINREVHAARSSVPCGRNRYFFISLSNNLLQVLKPLESNLLTLIAIMMVSVHSAVFVLLLPCNPFKLFFLFV